jgi:ABC-type nickel/cobalt efflux system permease component RcnA
VAVLGLLLVLLVAALVVGVIYDNGAASTLHVFGVGIDATVIGVFLTGAAAMLVLLLGLWLLTASARRARRQRRERKAMEHERAAHEAELEQERTRLAEERERLDAERSRRTHLPAAEHGAHDRTGTEPVDLRGDRAGVRSEPGQRDAVRSDTVYDPAAGESLNGRPVRPGDQPERFDRP